MFINQKVEGFLNAIKGLCTNGETVTTVPAQGWDKDKIVVSLNSNTLEFNVFSDSEIESINKKIREVFPDRTLDVVGFVTTTEGEFNFTVKNGVFKVMTFAEKFPPKDLGCLKNATKFCTAYMETCVPNGAYQSNSVNKTLQDLISNL